MFHHLLRIDSMRRRVVALLHQHWVRRGEVVQARYVPQREGQAGRGLAVRSVEDAALSRMLVRVHAHMKGGLDRRNRPFDLHLHTIARAAHHGKPVRFRKIQYSVVVLLRRTKSCRELRRSKETPVREAGRIVDLAQESIQAGLIPDRKNNVQLHGLRCGKSPNRLRLSIANHFAHMMRHEVLSLGCNTCGRQESRSCEQKSTDGSSHDLSLWGGFRFRCCGTNCLCDTAKYHHEGRTARKTHLVQELKSALGQGPERNREPRLQCVFGLENSRPLTEIGQLSPSRPPRKTLCGIIRLSDMWISAFGSPVLGWQ